MCLHIDVLSGSARVAATHSEMMSGQTHTCPHGHTKHSTPVAAAKRSKPMETVCVPIE